MLAENRKRLVYKMNDEELHKKINVTTMKSFKDGKIIFVTASFLRNFYIVKTPPHVIYILTL